MEHEVFIPVPAETLREALRDHARVARCVPGLQQDADESARPLSGRLKVRVGGHTITYRGALTLTERAGAFTAKGEGSEIRGTGSARLNVRIRLRESAGGTTVAFTATSTSEGRLSEIAPTTSEATARRLLDRFTAALGESGGAADSGDAGAGGPEGAAGAAGREPGVAGAGGGAGQDVSAAGEGRPGAATGAAAGQDGDVTASGAADDAGEGPGASGAADADRSGRDVTASGVASGAKPEAGGADSGNAGAGEPDGAAGAAGQAPGASGAGADSSAGQSRGEGGADREVSAADTAGAAGSGADDPAVQDQGVGAGDSDDDAATRAPDASGDGADDGTDADTDAADDDIAASGDDPDVHDLGDLDAPVPPSAFDASVEFGVTSSGEGDFLVPLDPPAEAAHARRTMIGRSAEEVDHAPPRGRYAPERAPDTGGAGAALRWVGPAAALAIAGAVVVGRALRRRR
ncbi:SRPBCC domain-containing protein [Streptomyces niveus]|uniref:SRPBCC domain-containing protein n=1 Tax=Streptomyces niveus TaxID=193462 RepID=UPI0033B5BF00